MSKERKSRSIITDFGSQRADHQSPQPEQRTDQQHTDQQRTNQSMSPVAPQRRRPSTTEPPQPRVSRTQTMKMPGSMVVPHAPPQFDQSQLYAHTRSQQAPSTVIQLHEHGLRTADRRLFLLNKPDSEQAAAFRVLRHQFESIPVQKRAHTSKTQVVAITSPDDRAGKSTTAVNLALSLAECDRARVLLVEANFRHPSLAKMFAFTPHRGWAKQMQNYHSSPQKRWHVDSFPASHLHVVALNRKHKGTALIDGPAFRYAIDGLRAANYHYIVIDCPSVLAGADVNLIQDSADGIILVARARQTTGRQMHESLERLSPASILGTILLGV